MPEAPPPPVSLSATSAERARVCFPPPLAPHECFSGGIFRDGVLCKWHLSCDLPREREGGREGGERRERDGEAKWRQRKDGRTDGRLPAAALLRHTFSSPFSPAAPFLFLRVDVIFLNSPPTSPGPSLCRSGAEPALFLA